jgi:hypothetical protein
MVKKNQFSTWYGLRTFAMVSGIASLLAIFGLPGAPGVKHDIAVGIASLGMAVTLSQLGPAGRVLSALAGAIAAGIGVIAIAEYAFSPYGALERLLFSAPSLSEPMLPGRPVPLVASILLLLGTAVLFPQSQGWRNVKALCALIVLLVAWTLSNGYWLGGFGSGAVTSADSAAGVPVTSAAAAALLLAALGALASQPAVWPTSVFFGGGLAGVVCRWLVPAAALAPPLLGWSVADPATLRDPEGGLRLGPLRGFILSGRSRLHSRSRAPHRAARLGTCVRRTSADARNAVLR